MANGELRRFEHLLAVELGDRHFGGRHQPEVLLDVSITSNMRSLVDTYPVTQYPVFMGTRISTELTDPRLMKLLKAEANERDSTVKDVLSRALEAYFAERLETKALAKLAEASFAEWDDPRDADYDRL